MTASRFTLGFLTALLTLSLGSAAETRGNIVKVDPAKKELVIALAGLGVPRGQVMTFVLGPDAKVEVGLILGQPGTLGSLATGQRIHVNYEERGGQKVVTEIHIVALLSPPPKNGAVAKAPAGEGEIKGALRRISITEREIIVAFAGPKGEDYSPILVPAEATILRDGKPIRFEDLKDEEGVIVQTEKDPKNGRSVARAIQAGEAVALPATSSDVKFGVARLRQLVQMPGQLQAQGSDAKQQLPVDPALLQKAQGLLQQLDRILEMVEQGQRKK